ncbi:haloalkane dehalogenase [Shinella yambaruensis]|uniref:Haloalkane dehalogenase n=1 Tax=Shinella yambaruensis TaxID=415996 RepID=A0ABQ5ZLN4_9HYPH|nr:haloalkane dehalogenase [Shinella yambaruensis]MCJ8028374.1 haloalkane dehalogenase [Shinella yambaruensis]MCU7981427.1 haloalkane dehalogenase [Shinella yambaruensis]GLR53543.1 haloalkane dehalogenase [Shinella yambaruensis]
MTINAQPFATKKYIEIKGRRMAYIDEGEGAPIVFQHGNGSSSFLWRNIMPASRGLGRLIACDLIGMGDSEKLPNAGPDNYTFKENREFLFALWEELGINKDVVLVLHDWGSALGFDWANQHQDRVQGIAFMESIVQPLRWSEFPEYAVELFRTFRSPQGEELVLKDNAFIEKVVAGSVLDPLDEAVLNEYRRPFLEAGEGRRPTLTWPRQLPIDGEPADVHEIVESYSRWLAENDVPKLYVNVVPGVLDAGRQREFTRSFKSQREITVRGAHYVQEESPKEIGDAIAEFIRDLRGL